MKNNLKDIIRQAIDIHVHIGPEIIPRKYNLQDLIKAEKGKIGGFVLKNHFYPTVPFIKEIKYKNDLQIFGSVVLNNAIGGLNSEAIYGSSLLSEKPLMVWFPTTNSENFLTQSEYEIRPEWVNDNKFEARISKNIKPVKLTNGNELAKECIEVLHTIKKCNAVLATGHISWKESEILVKKAIELGIKKIVITHPIYQYIDMPIKVQRELSKKGIYSEQCYSMFAIDKIPIAKIANQIKEIGPDFVILSSDVGQIFSPSPSEALFRFSSLLKKEGVNEEDLFTMLVKNPKKLLGID